MRAYIDTNVVIDLLAKRKPYWEQAKEILLLITDHAMVGYISVSAFTDIYYIGKKIYHDEEMTRKKMAELLYFLEVLPIGPLDVKTAFDTPLTDYEDGLIEEISYRDKLDCIITGNKKDFKNSRIPVFTPSEFLKEFIRKNKKETASVKKAKK